MLLHLDVQKVEEEELHHFGTTLLACIQCLDLVCKALFRRTCQRARVHAQIFAFDRQTQFSGIQNLLMGFLGALRRDPLECRSGDLNV